MLFCDLDDATRFGFRDAIEAAGGSVEGYDGEAVLVAVPHNGERPGFYTAMKAAGLEVVPGSVHYFPLGSDKPPETLRHALSKYGPARSFWCLARLRPIGEQAAQVLTASE